MTAAVIGRTIETRADWLFSQLLAQLKTGAPEGKEAKEAREGTSAAGATKGEGKPEEVAPAAIARLRKHYDQLKLRYGGHRLLLDQVRFFCKRFLHHYGRNASAWSNVQNWESQLGTEQLSIRQVPSPHNICPQASVSVSIAPPNIQDTTSINKNNLVDPQQPHQQQQQEQQQQQPQKQQQYLFKCRQCHKGDQVQFTQKQTRGADEPMTQFFECKRCGVKWRTGG
jgi:DNA-directed RNA polymerase subunit M/transcription elongation factor TFIIS